MPALHPHALGFDTETRGLRWRDPDQRAFLGTWADATKEYVGAFVGDGAKEGRERYLSALQGAPSLVAHNTKFDAHQTLATLGHNIFEQPDCDIHDTDLMSRILMPEGQRKDRGGHGLKNLSEVFLRADAKEAEDAIKHLAKNVLGRKSLKEGGAYYDVWRAYPSELETYALLDARYTRDLAELFLPKFDSDQRLWDLYNLERDVQRVLFRAEQRGVKVDPDHVASLKKLYEKRLADAGAKCLAVLGFIPESEDDEEEGVKERLAKALLKAGVDLTEVTPTGQLATNKKALSRFKDHPAVAALFDYRHQVKFLQTYINPMEGVDYVHPDFNQAEAWTGRMSCRNPNMQNLPKRADSSAAENERIRGMFVPREDHYFVVADYEAMEPRILAHYLGVPWYRELVDQGRTYEKTCVDAWGGKEEDYVKGSDKEFLRNAAKLVYLSICYGGGGAVVRSNVNENTPPEYHLDEGWVKDPDNKYDTPPEAQALKKKVMAGIPGFGTWNSGLNGKIRDQIERIGEVRTILGRRQIIDPDKSYVGMNALIQGSAADIMKAAARDMASGTEGEPLLFVHDEALVEFPNDYDPEKAVREVSEIMESAVKLTIPLRVEANHTDKNYAAAK